MKSLLLLILIFTGAQAAQAQTASLTFDTYHFDFGRVPVNTKVKHRFKLKNPGSVTAEIFSVSSSCSCTIPYYSKKIAPNSGGYIDIELNTEKLSGVVNRYVVVTTNTQQELYKLTVTATIK